MLNYIEYLNIPAKIGVIIIAVVLIMQLIVEFLEFKGKVVPEFLKIGNYFSKRRKEKKDTVDTLKDVKRLLNDVNSHYSEDNIAKRNDWMQWVNSRAEIYDDSIVDINKSLSDVTQALNANTRLTEEMFVQSSRDRIIDFSYKAADDNALISREEFERIFKVYDKYEDFLKDHGMTNGEIDIVYGIIKESYEQRVKNHTFIEDIRVQK